MHDDCAESNIKHVHLSIENESLARIEPAIMLFMGGGGGASILKLNMVVIVVRIASGVISEKALNTIIYLIPRGVL